MLETILADEPLNIDEKFFFVYIRYHHLYFSDYQERIAEEPNQCLWRGGKRLHFYKCNMLIEMEQEGRIARYCHVEHLVDNKCEIDLEDRKEVMARLGWCQSCLKILFRNGGVNVPEDHLENFMESVSKGGDWKIIMDCVKSYHHRKGDDSAEKIQQFFLAFLPEYVRERMGRQRGIF